MVYIMCLAAGILLGMLAGGSYMIVRCGRTVEAAQETEQKYRRSSELASEWLRLRGENRTAEEYLKANKYEKIAIYGKGGFAQQLEHDLECWNYNIAYYIDRKGWEMYDTKEVYRPDDKLPETDVIIVTIISEFEEIKKKLQADGNDRNIISLEDFILEYK